MIELKDIVFEFVKKNGPVLPVQVSKNINTNILLASAILSGLVSEKKVFLTHQNIGGSPLYYVKGQESKLDILYKHLENAEKEAYDLLKNKKILKDIDLTAVYRVALRNIKDFAFKLEVSVDNKSEIFWKWYLIDNNEAEKIIKGILEEGVSPLSTPEKPSTPENLSTQRTLLGKAFTENEAVGSLLTSEINSTVQERVLSEALQILHQHGNWNILFFDNSVYLVQSPPSPLSWDAKSIVQLFLCHAELGSASVF